MGCLNLDHGVARHSWAWLALSVEAVWQSRESSACRGLQRGAESRIE